MALGRKKRNEAAVKACLKVVSDIVATSILAKGS